MAEETGPQVGALKIAGAVHEYARHKDWAPSDYHIFMKYKPDYHTLSTTVVAKAFERRTEAQEYSDYDDVMDEIEKALKGQRYFNYFGLVLTGKDGFAFYPQPRPGTAEVEVDEKLINNGVSWSEPFRPGPR